MKYEVVIEGHFCQSIIVEADNYEDAESLAATEFNSIKPKGEYIVDGLVAKVLNE